MAPAIALLSAEHRALGRVLSALEATAVQLERAVAVEHSWLREVTTFLVEHADGSHHAKEEGVLFKALLAHGQPLASSAVAVLLTEHDGARHLTADLAVHASRIADGQAPAAADWAAAAVKYARGMRGHMLAEERVLFPMAQVAIPESILATLHEHYAEVLPAGADALELAADRLVQRAFAWWPSDAARPPPP